VSSVDPRFQGRIFVLRDITERKRAERRIRYLARFATLTKMPNRMQFQHLLHQAITRGLRQGRGLVLLYVDLDNFKEINDTFGHEAGDRVLETVSERLSRILPKESVVGRLAGDEFAVFAETSDGERDRHEQAASLARLLLNEVARPQHVGEHELEVTASIGIAACPENGDNVIDLIRNADAAMYHAKRAGRNCHVFYAPEMNAAAVERLLLKSKLRRALDRDEFVLRYQPKVDLASGLVVGAEALLRWRLPGHGEIAPAQFIQHALAIHHGHRDRAAAPRRGNVHREVRRSVRRRHREGIGARIPRARGRPCVGRVIHPPIERFGGEAGGGEGAPGGAEHLELEEPIAHAGVSLEDGRVCVLGAHPLPYQGAIAGILRRPCYGQLGAVIERAPMPDRQDIFQQLALDLQVAPLQPLRSESECQHAVGRVGL
jgi:diguanylate cyclase (GGDEF)-like protein